MLNVYKQSALMVSVFMLNVFIGISVMVVVSMLSVVMLNVGMLSLSAPGAVVTALCFFIPSNGPNKRECLSLASLSSLV